GGKSHLLKDGETVTEIVQRHYPEAARIISRTTDSQLGNVDLDQLEKLTDLHGLDLAILPAQLGVAENAAVWLTEAEMGQRVVPFIAEHLVLVLDRKDVVSDMHQAYKRIEIDEPGFGLFIAGPSKTADIEQSLVIGAQGPRTWLVILV
ncbi:MAG: LUD domain-containing protein, partial [Saprospiraceae bacterium]